MTMYAVCHGKREITLWCTGQLKPLPKVKIKREHPEEDDDAASFPKTKAAKLMLEIRVILKKLQEKHGHKYTIKQYNSWAHMLQIGTYSSYEDVPELPYFGRKKRVSQSPAAAGTEPVVPTVSSRSECIQELNQWYSLLEKGAITTIRCSHRSWPIYLTSSLI